MTKTTQTVLAFDTSLNGISISVQNEGEIYKRFLETERDQAARLVPLMKDTLEQADCSFQDMDLIISTVGPGSFTGTRIGMTTAKILAFSSGTPLLGLSTIDFIAYHYTPQRNMLIVLETKRSDYYTCLYDSELKPISDPQSLSSSDIIDQMKWENISIGGNAVKRLSSEIDTDFDDLEEILEPDPAILISLGLDRYHAGHMIDFEPLYLRGADVSQPKHKPKKLAQV